MEVVTEHSSGAQIAELFCAEEDEMSGLMLGFKTIWEEKADYESLIYSGNRANNSRRNAFLDEVSDSLLSWQRLYNQKFMD
jgi:hypothetical protein